jgi:type I restriction enzyme S subunit
MKLKTLKLGDILDYEQPTKYIVESTDYNDSFSIPVLTAGKSFILGYTDETEGVFSDLPVIIFDDFTTAIKYVDFPFKVKSSAMKILKAKREIANIKYLYYKMQTIRANNTEHKRYWISKYAEFEFPIPSLLEQKKIVSILDTADKLRQQDKALVAKYDELTESLFLDMFGDPTINSKGWPLMSLESVCNEVIDCPHSTPKYVNEVTAFPCIRTTELKEGYIDWAKMKYLNEKEYLNRVKRLTPKEGDIIYGREGTFGEAIIIPTNIKMSLGQRVMLFRPNREIVNSVFLHSIIRSKSVYSQALKANTGSTVGHVNVKDVKKFSLTIPPLKLQNQYEVQVRIIEEQKKIARLSLLKSEELFNSLLKKMFQSDLITKN